MFTGIRRALLLEIVKNMSPSRHLFVSREHRTSFRAKVIFGDYRARWTCNILQFAKF
jgi:hypothetical protein